MILNLIMYYYFNLFIFDRPDGQIDLQADVPKEPMSWVISAVTMSRTKGFGVVKQPTRVRKVLRCI